MRNLGLSKAPVFMEKGDAVVTSEFGVRKHPITGEVSYHSGLDLVRLVGDKHDTAIITAIADGVVEDICDCVKGYDEVFSKGNYVRIRHKSGKISLYLHMEYGSIPKSLKVGASVNKGATIGYMGNTGRSSGAHLHFQTYADDGKTVINPEPFLMGKDICERDDDMFIKVEKCKRGDKGDFVKKLQLKLSQQSEEFEAEVKGHSADKFGNMDGVFGKGLEATLIKFQESAGIKATGECDDETCNVLNTSIAEMSGKIKTAVNVLN